MKLDKFEIMKSVRKGQRRPTMIEEGQRGKTKYNRKEKYKKGWTQRED